MSDLISRKQAICAIDNDDEYAYYQTKRNMESIPPADIIECARTIKEYCERFPECEGCRFYKGYPFGCAFGMCPQEWKLPEGEKK